MKTRYLLVLVWAGFIGRGLFYCTVEPLWDGFDEWAYFSVADRTSIGPVLVDRNMRVSKEVEASLALAPLPRGMTAVPPAGVIYDAYWNLAGTERYRRESGLRALPPAWANEEATDGMPAYEASQPPLYYWILSLPLKTLRQSDLVSRVWLARCFTLLIGSLVIPIAFVVARQFFGDGQTALSFAALLAVTPGLALDVSRVSNESLAVVVYSLLLWFALDWPLRRHWPALGLVLGLGLLTKAYFLTAIPALAVLCCLQLWRDPARREARVPPWAGMFELGFVIAGWWYVRNYLQTGTISGLDEALMLRGQDPATFISGFLSVEWSSALAVTLLSHVWYGNWNLLTLPHWIYYASFVVAGAAVAGLCRRLYHHRAGAKLPALLCLYGFFWIGQAYHIVELKATKHSSTAMGGWYLYAVILPEMLLCVVGLVSLFPRASVRRVLQFLTIAAVALDLYGVHAVLIPYYTHHAPLDLQVILGRLLLNKPAIVLRGATLQILWVVYVAFTAGIILTTLVTRSDRDVIPQAPSTRV